ncbi:MAG: FtsX-like permease family protein, partial [Candidatus Thorarchaeota archaeon]
YELSAMTIAGIYEILPRTGLLYNAFRSYSRNNWDPFGGSVLSETIFGFFDSVMILQSDLPEAVIDEVADDGFFNPVWFVTQSWQGLVAAGPSNAAGNLVRLKTTIEEHHPDVYVDGLLEVWSLDTHIKTYERSRILTVITTPILLMSLMLTVFTSETSIVRRKGEVSALRAKGASYNQVLSAFVWESVVLGSIGFLLGISLSLIIAPTIAATSGLFTIESNIYMQFLERTMVPTTAIIVAFAITLYLPLTYLVHVTRRLEVMEIGVPFATESDDEIDDTSGYRYIAMLVCLMFLSLSTAIISNPSGSFAVVLILTMTVIMFLASYLGSGLIQITTAKALQGTAFILGEKCLYLGKSLKNRRRQFAPLLIILTLTFTTTSMLVIENSSIDSTIQNEVSYALGADIRVECSERNIGFSEILMNYEGVLSVTPVLTTSGQIGSTTFTIASINAHQYSTVGLFSEESIIGEPATSALSRLANVSNGIIISEYHSHLWNKTSGDEIDIRVSTRHGNRLMTFIVVGLMHSTPGLGSAEPLDDTDQTIGTMFGFQVNTNGFVLTNLDFLSDSTNIRTANLFLVDTFSFSNTTLAAQQINQIFEVKTYTPERFSVESRRYSLNLFINGFRSLTIVGIVMCTVMGIFALTMFLSSTVLERRTEYAIIRALGATRKHILTLAMSEFAGSVITAVAASIVLGLVFGFSMSIITLGIFPFAPVLSVIVSFPFMLMIPLILFQTLVLVVSCYIPARNASMVNPATNLRNL